MESVAPMLVERPSPPDANTDEDMMWRKEAAITFEGGYIVATYGNLAQTWDLGNTGAACPSVDVTRQAYTVQRTNTIGGDTKAVSFPVTTYKRFPRVNASIAAGGEPFTFVTDIGEYTARIGGDVQTVVDWICTNRSALFGTLSIFTNRGAQYGPFGNNSI